MPGGTATLPYPATGMQRLRQRDRELAAARARVAKPEAEAAAVRAWLEQVRGQPAFDDAVSGTTRLGRCEQVRFCRQLR